MLVKLEVIMEILDKMEDGCWARHNEKCVIVRDQVVIKLQYPLHFNGYDVALRKIRINKEDTDGYLNYNKEDLQKEGL